MVSLIAPWDCLTKSAVWLENSWWHDSPVIQDSTWSRNGPWQPRIGSHQPQASHAIVPKRYCVQVVVANTTLQPIWSGMLPITNYPKNKWATEIGLCFVQVEPAGNCRKSGQTFMLATAGSQKADKAQKCSWRQKANRYRYTRKIPKAFPVKMHQGHSYSHSLLIPIGPIHRKRLSSPKAGVNLWGPRVQKVAQHPFQKLSILPAFLYFQLVAEGHHIHWINERRVLQRLYFLLHETDPAFNPVRAASYGGLAREVTRHGQVDHRNRIGP